MAARTELKIVTRTFNTAFWGFVRVPHSAPKIAAYSPSDFLIANTSFFGGMKRRRLGSCSAVGTGTGTAQQVDGVGEQELDLGHVQATQNWFSRLLFLSSMARS